MLIFWIIKIDNGQGPLYIIKRIAGRNDSLFILYQQSRRKAVCFIPRFIRIDKITQASGACQCKSAVVTARNPWIF